MSGWVLLVLTVDLVFHHLALQLVAVIVFDRLGAFATLEGQVALLIMAALSCRRRAPL